MISFGNKIFNIVYESTLDNIVTFINVFNIIVMFMLYSGMNNLKNRGKWV